MIDIPIPGLPTVQIDHLVLDVNGTIALDGELLPGVSDRLARLKPLVKLWLLSADTHGRLDEVAAALAVKGVRLEAGYAESEQKADFVRQLGASCVAALGNGANDVGMLRVAGLGIGVLGREGLACSVLQVADIVVPSIDDGLDLLIHPVRVMATLRV